MAENEKLTGRETQDAEDRYMIVYTASGPYVSHPTDGCRRYDCCGGTECGSTFEEVKQDLKDYYQNILDRIEALDARTIRDFRP